MTRMFRRLRCAMPLVVAITASSPLVAAGGVEPPAIDACALLTAEEVSAALGETAEPGRSSSNGVTEDGANSTTCLWAVRLPAGTAPDPTKSLGGRRFAILNVMNWPGGAQGAQKFLDSFQKAFESHEIGSKPVPVEIGADAALWWGDGVAARKDGVSFGISVASAGDRAARQPKAERLAKLVVQRLAKSSPGS